MLKKLYSFLKEIYIIRTIKRSGLFDKEYYLKNNLDVARSCMNPIKHYIRHGWKEGRKPNQYFDTKWYLKTYPDVAASSMNPFYHYLRHKINNGYNPKDKTEISISTPFEKGKNKTISNSVNRILTEDLLKEIIINVRKEIEHL